MSTAKYFAAATLGEAYEQFSSCSRAWLLLECNWK